MTLDQLAALWLGIYFTTGVIWLLSMVLREKHYTFDKLLGVFFFGHTILGFSVGIIWLSVYWCIKCMPKWLFKEWK